MMFKSRRNTKELSKELTEIENKLSQKARELFYEDEKNINIDDLESFNKEVVEFNKKVEFSVQRCELVIRDGKVKVKRQ